MKVGIDGVWSKVERDERGIATDECLDEISESLPVILLEQTDGFYEVYLVEDWVEYIDYRDVVESYTRYTHYMKITLPCI